MKRKIEFVKNCPLGTAPFESVFDSFYFNQNETGFSPKRAPVDEIISRQIQCNKPLPKLLCYQDKWWRFSKIVYPGWESGHLHLKKTSRGAFNDREFPAHFHADLLVYDDVYHIDHYAVAYGGPRSFISEIRVFQNEQLIARGGRGHVSIAGFSRNLPFIIAARDYILLFRDVVQIDPIFKNNTKISFWRLCSEIRDSFLSTCISQAGIDF